MRACGLLPISGYHPGKEKAKRSPESLNIYPRQTRLTSKISLYRKGITLPFMGSFSSIHKKMGSQA